MVVLQPAKRGYVVVGGRRGPGWLICSIVGVRVAVLVVLVVSALPPGCDGFVVSAAMHPLLVDVSAVVCAVIDVVLS